MTEYGSDTDYSNRLLQMLRDLTSFMLGVRMREPEVGTTASANCSRVCISGFLDIDKVADLAHWSCAKCCNERRRFYIEPTHQCL